MAFTSNAAYGNSSAIALPQIDTEYLGLDFFMHQPDVLNEIVPGWDTQNFLRMLELTGRAEVCHNEVFTNYESGMNYRAIGIQAISGTATASAVTVTLTADSYTNVGSLKGNVDRSPLKQNDIIKLPNRKEAFVQLKGAQGGQATTYTLVKSDRAADAAFDLGAYISSLAGTSQRLGIPSNGFSEGSKQPLEGIDVPLVRYSGTMQIFKAHMAVTGSAAGDTTHVTMPGGGNKWYSKTLLDLGLKHRTDMAFQHLLGNGGNFVDTDGKKVKTSQGLEGYIRTLGNVYDYPGSGFTLADLDALVNRIKALWGGNEYQWIMGSTLRAQVEGLIRNFTNGNIVYNMFGNGDAKSRAVDLGFNSFTYQGITFHMQESGVFLHPEVTALAGYNYDSMGILIPGKTQRITTSDNGITKNIDAPSLRIRYKVDVDNKSRRYSEWKMPKEITGIDETRFEILSHEGLQMVGLRRFILTQKGA